MLSINQDFKDLIPPLSADEYEDLKESITEFGCRDAIVIWNGVIIDGHNRFEICIGEGIPYSTCDMSDDFESEDEVKQWIIKNQFGRRNINTFQRSALALKLKDIIAGKAKENQLSGLKQFDTVLMNSSERMNDNQYDDTVPMNSPERCYRENETREQLAKIAGVSGQTIDRVEAIQRDAPEVVKSALVANDMSVNKAYEITKAVKDLPPEEQPDEAARLMSAPTRVRRKTPECLQQAFNKGKLHAPEGLRIVCCLHDDDTDEERNAHAERLLKEYYEGLAYERASETRKLRSFMESVIYNALKLVIDDAHVDAYLDSDFTLDERLDECSRAIRKLEDLQEAIAYRKKLRVVK